MMNRKIIILGLGVIVLLGIIFFAIQSFSSNKGPASLKITSNPSSTVFLDTQHLGKTPYENQVKAGEYTLKLIPEGGSLPSWETKIKISPGVLTYANRDFGEQELTSAGEILTLEKISGQRIEVAVISQPDNASVTMDGTLRGNTPLMIADVEPGDHELNVEAPGFILRGAKIKTTPGFKVVASFQLAMSSTSPTASPTPEASPTTSPKATPKASPKPSPKPTVSPSAQLPRPYVTILDTPTGFLRVRVEPSTSATEAARVNPGESFSLLGEQSGWYKIRYESTKEGWISGQYAEKFE